MKTGYRLAALAFLSQALCCALPAPAIAQVLGGACSLASQNTPFGNTDYLLYMKCISSVWTAEAIQPGAATQSCASGTAGQIQWTGAALQYCNGSSWTSIGTAGGGALSALTAATGANTITGNGDNAQAWQWALTTATNSGITFGESSAAANGAGAQSVVKIATLATSTAMPLWIVNAGATNSLEVDDQASDTTPFVIDASGNVGIGAATPADQLTFGVAPAASATHALINLTNNLSGLSASGTYIAANPVSAGADFINYEVAGVGHFAVNKNGGVGIVPITGAGAINASSTVAGATAYSFAYATTTAATQSDGIALTVTDSTTGTGPWTGIFENTGALSAATGAKLLMDLQTNSVSKFSVNTAGAASATNFSATNTSPYYAGYFVATGYTAILAQGYNGGVVGITTNTGNGVTGEGNTTTSGFFQTYNTSANGNTAPTLVTKQGTNQTTAHLFEAQSSGGAVLDAIDSSGNVGIGTATPKATLDVNGYAKLNINASAPVTCDAAHEGSIAYTGTTTHYLCFCNGSAWEQDSAPASACTW